MPDDSRYEAGNVHGGWQRSISNRLDGVAHDYGRVCWLFCVFTAAGIALLQYAYGWPWDMFMMCYCIVLFLWVFMSILLLCRSAARWVCGGLSYLAARRTEATGPPSVEADVLDAQSRAGHAEWGGSPMGRRDSLPDVWQGN